MQTSKITINTGCPFVVTRTKSGTPDAVMKFGASTQLWQTINSPLGLTKDSMLSAMVNAVVDPEVAGVELRKIQIVLDPHTSALKCIVRGYDGPRIQLLAKQLVAKICQAVDCPVDNIEVNQLNDYNETI